ncbi:MAG: septal ring lytic transglycosylase RlpA family protein [Nitrospiraceae bacterium]
MPEARRANCRLFALSLLIAAGFTACQGGPPRQPVHPQGYPLGFVERGTASWYGPGFHGNRTANGEVYDMHKLTAAHRTLPLGSLALVTSLSTGRQVTVRINDRGPFARGRILDLSLAGAQALDMTGRGTDEVQLQVVGYNRLSSEVGVLRLQVASFGDFSNAQALADKLKGSYSDVRLVTVELPDGHRYRVQAGQFQTEAQADAAAHHLRKWLHVDPLVIRDDT